MIDLRLFHLEVELEGRKYFLLIRKRFTGLDLVRVYEIVDDGFNSREFKSLDFNHVSKTPFTFRNVCWALWQNLKYCFKFVFAKVRFGR